VGIRGSMPVVLCVKQAADVNERIFSISFDILLTYVKTYNIFCETVEAYECLT
jgi:hypothetical protein